MRIRVNLGWKRFRRDEDAIVTVQMVMFSIMLFGGIGLMMDFGRAYSAHSQMQAYVDQVALAAAAELDGKSDAISRATTAANAVAKSSSFVDGSGAFQLQSLTFMTASPTDTNGDFSKSLAATYATTTAEVATYVRAEAATRSVSMTLLNFAVDDSDGFDSIDITAAATATSRTVSCGGLSPMVMCNPFENRNDTSWQAEMENGQGYRMKLTANVTNGGRPSNYSGTTDSIQLGLLKSPHTLMDVRNTICSTTGNLPGYGSSSLSTEELRDICMLATVRTGLSCVNDQVAYKAAPPSSLTTGLGVVFDMYDGPMAEVMDPGEDFSFAHSFPTSLGLPTNLNRSELFYPDIVPVHGRMTREHFIAYLDEEIARLQAQVDDPAFPFFLKPGLINSISALNDQKTAYAEDPLLDDFSRQNYVLDPGKRTEWGPAPIESCIEAENCTASTADYPVIFSQAPGNNDVKAYAAGLYKPYLAQQVQAASGGAYADWWDVPSGVLDSSPLVAGATTYYDFYSDVERTNTDLHPETATLGHRDMNGSNPIPINGDGYGAYGIQASAENFSNVYSTSAIGSEERRVQRITVVNCEAAETYAAATGDTSSAFSDTYMGDVVDVIDAFLLTPPQVQGCSPAMANDPLGSNLCPNTDVTDVDLDVELVDAASINPVNFDARFYSVLVH